jgi:hypothetical protein
VTFKIPKPIMPTESELRITSAKWLSVVGPTLIDQWPADLLKLSAPTVFVELPQNLAEIMFGDHWCEKRRDLAEVAAQIDRVCDWDSKFFRLNSRSAKDSPWPFETLVSCSGREMFNVMASSERMLGDLCYFTHATVKPILCLREFWPEVRPEREFRCFIVDGQIMAVAEYRNRGETSWNREGLSSGKSDADLRQSIDRYLIDVVKPRLHINTIVVDICHLHSGWRLLEINPYGRSDPVGAQSYDRIEAGIPDIARLPEKQADDERAA